MVASTSVVPPPPSNTGVEITRGRLDWLEGSVRGMAVEELQRMLTADNDGDWVSLEHGMLGYASAVRSRLGVTVMYDDRRPEIHFCATGDVLECWARVEVQALGALLLAKGASFSRVDSCIDVPYAVATVEDFREGWKEGSGVSHARHAHYEVDDSRTTGPEDAALPGRTWYLGSPKSDRKLRVYDKGAQDASYGDVTRVELEERNEAGTEAVRQFVGSEYGAYFAGRLLSFVDYREGPQVNVSQRARALWFMALVGACAAAEAYPPKEAQTVAQLVAWVEKQVAPMLAALNAGGHIDMHELLYTGARRWRSHHEQIAGLAA